MSHRAKEATNALIDLYPQRGEVDRGRTVWRARYRTDLWRSLTKVGPIWILVAYEPSQRSFAVGEKAQAPLKPFAFALLVT